MPSMWVKLIFLFCAHPVRGLFRNMTIFKIIILKMPLFLDEMDLGCTSDEEKITAGSIRLPGISPAGTCLCSDYSFSKYNDDKQV